MKYLLFTAHVVRVSVVFCAASAPVFAADSADFSRHNRFVFAPNYYPLEPYRAPNFRAADSAVRALSAPQHAVRAGRVKLPNIGLNDLIDPPAPAYYAAPTHVPAPAFSTLFGSARPPQVVSPVPPAAPSPAFPAEPPATQPVRAFAHAGHAGGPSLAHAGSYVVARAGVRGRVKRIAPPPDAVASAAAYSQDVGYSYGSAYETATNSARGEVRGVVLPPRGVTR